MINWIHTIFYTEKSYLPQKKINVNVTINYFDKFLSKEKKSVDGKCQTHWAKKKRTFHNTQSKWYFWCENCIQLKYKSLLKMSIKTSKSNGLLDASKRKYAYQTKNINDEINLFVVYLHLLVFHVCAQMRISNILRSHCLPRNKYMHVLKLVWKF